MSSPEGNMTTANYTDNVLHIINILEAATAVINILLSTPLHAYIIWLIITGTGNGLASEFFSLQLATSETVFNLGSIMIPLKSVDQSLKRPLSYFLTFLLISRPLFETCICMERYLAVLHPVLFLKFRPLRYRLVISAVGWLIAINCSLFNVFISESPIVFILNTPLLLVMLFCCLAIIKALKQPGPGEVVRQEVKANQAKMKAFKAILTILLSLQVDYIIIIAVGVMLMSGVSPEVKSISFYMSFLTTVITGFTYPLLYLRRMRKLPCVSASASQKANSANQV